MTDKPTYHCVVCGSNNQGQVDEAGRIRCKNCNRQIRKSEIEAAESEVTQPAKQLVKEEKAGSDRK